MEGGLVTEGGWGGRGARVTEGAGSGGGSGD